MFLNTANLEALGSDIFTLSFWFNSKEITLGKSRDFWGSTIFNYEDFFVTIGTDLYEEWSSDKTYQNGDIIYYGENYYQVTEAISRDQIPDEFTEVWSNYEIPNNVFYIYVHQGDLSNPIFKSSNQYDTGENIHFVFSKEYNLNKIYINGILEETTFDDFVFQGKYIQIGFDENNKYSGYLQDLRLIKKIEYFNEFEVPQNLSQTCFGSRNDPDCNNVKLHLQSSRKDGLEIIDKSGQSQKITHTRGQVENSDSFPKYGGSSIYFNGSSSIEVETFNQDWKIEDNFSIELWIRPIEEFPSTLDSDGNIIDLSAGSCIIGNGVSAATGQSGQLGWALIAVDGQYKLLWNDNGGDSFNNLTVVSGSNVEIGKWNHVAISFSKNYVKTFYNGNVTSSLLRTKNIFYPSDKLTLGNRISDQGTYFFKGFIQDLVVVKNQFLYARGFSLAEGLLDLCVLEFKQNQTESNTETIENFNYYNPQQCNNLILHLKADINNSQISDLSSNPKQLKLINNIQIIDDTEAPGNSAIEFSQKSFTSYHLRSDIPDDKKINNAGLIELERGAQDLNDASFFNNDVAESDSAFNSLEEGIITDSSIKIDKNKDGLNVPIYSNSFISTPYIMPNFPQEVFSRSNWRVGGWFLLKDFTHSVTLFQFYQFFTGAKLPEYFNWSVKVDKDKKLLLWHNALDQEEVLEENVSDEITTDQWFRVDVVGDSENRVFKLYLNDNLILSNTVNSVGVNASKANWPAGINLTIGLEKVYIEDSVNSGSTLYTDENRLTDLGLRNSSFELCLPADKTLLSDVYVQDFSVYEGYDLNTEISSAQNVFTPIENPVGYITAINNEVSTVLHLQSDLENINEENKNTIKDFGAYNLDIQNRENEGIFTLQHDDENLPFGSSVIKLSGNTQTQYSPYEFMWRISGVGDGVYVSSNESTPVVSNWLGDLQGYQLRTHKNHAIIGSKSPRTVGRWGTKFNLSNRDFTIETHINFSENINRSTLIDTGYAFNGNYSVLSRFNNPFESEVGSSSGSNGWALINERGIFKFCFHTPTGVKKLRIVNIDVDRWYHIAVQRSDGYLYSYVNGILQESLFIGEGPILNSDTGHYNGNSDLFSEEDRGAVTFGASNPRKGLLRLGSGRRYTYSYWKYMHEEYPLKGYVQDFIIQLGQVKYSTEGFLYPKSLQVIENELPKGTIPEENDDFTLDFWFYGTEKIGYQNIISSGNYSQNGTPTYEVGMLKNNQSTPTKIIAKFVTPDNPLAYKDVFKTSRTIVIADRKFIPNTWNHVAITRKDGIIYTFFNGSQGGALSHEFVKEIDFAGGDIHIGGRPEKWVGDRFGINNQKFEGRIQDLRLIKNEALYNGPFLLRDRPINTNECFNSQTVCPSILIQSNDDEGNRTIKDYSQFNHLMLSGGNPIHSSRKTIFNSISSLYFNGSSYIESESSNELYFQDSFTIEFWFLIKNHIGNSHDDRNYVFNITNDTDETKFSFDNNGFIYLDLPASTGGSIQSRANIQKDTWSHIAVVRSGPTFSLYLNGVLLNQFRSSSRFNDGAYKLLIGTENKIDGFSDIYIQDFIVTKNFSKSPIAILPTELAPTNCSAVCPDLLIQSNETNGITEFLDKGTYKHEIVNVNNVEHSTLAKPPYGSSSIRFNGDNNYLQIQPVPETQIGSEFTLELWFYIYQDNKIDGDNEQILIQSHDASGGPFKLFVNQTEKSLNFVTNLIDQDTYTYKLKTEDNYINYNLWYHVAISSNENSVELYINGEEIDSSDLSNEILSRNDTIIIGKQLNGFIQDIRLLNKNKFYNSIFKTPVQFWSYCFSEPEEVNCENVLLHLQNQYGDVEFYDRSGKNHRIDQFGGVVHENIVKYVTTGPSIFFDGESSTKLELSPVYRDLFDLKINEDFTIETF